MTFTKEEAEAKKGRWVRLRDHSLSRFGIAKGTRGRVVRTQLWGQSGTGTGQLSTISLEEEVWAVDVRFYLSQEPSATLLIGPIGKAEYERSLEEIKE